MKPIRSPLAPNQVGVTLLPVPGSEYRLAGPEAVDLRTRRSIAVPRVDQTTCRPSCVMAANRAGRTPLTRTAAARGVAVCLT